MRKPIDIVRIYSEIVSEHFRRAAARRSDGCRDHTTRQTIIGEKSKLREQFKEFDANGWSRSRMYSLRVFPSDRVENFSLRAPEIFHYIN